MDIQQSKKGTGKTTKVLGLLPRIMNCPIQGPQLSCVLKNIPVFKICTSGAGQFRLRQICFGVRISNARQHKGLLNL
jgi:hypothetical protein